LFKNKNADEIDIGAIEAIERKMVQELIDLYDIKKDPCTSKCKHVTSELPPKKTFRSSPRFFFRCKILIVDRVWPVFDIRIASLVLGNTSEDECRGFRRRSSLGGVIFGCLLVSVEAASEDITSGAVVSCLVHELSISIRKGVAA
jgi:hypothetical protein